ncbi:TraM recognition domain-containing protein [Omnitrophica bacterium]|nr:TraM recognition domain-containing protein [Candidatus Omnitrophota bacterium]
MAKPQPKPDPLLIRFIAGIFIQVPLSLAGMLLALLSKAKKPWLEKLLWGITVSGSILTAVSLSQIFEVFRIQFTSQAGGPFADAALRSGLLYLVYLVISLPVFLAAAWLGEHSKLFKGETLRRASSPERMWRQRLKSGRFQVYLGESFQRTKSLFLTNDQREMHMQVVGSTGTGKTESVLLPMLAHDITHGKGALVIDGKGDRELLDRIHHIVKSCGRRKDLYYFSLADPDSSNTYNPLLRGNATELKDKIVGSMAWSEEFYRRMAEQAALTLLNGLIATRQKVRFRTLYACLTDIKSLQALSDKTQSKDPDLQQDLVKMVNSFKENQKFLSGLMADLYLSSRSEFSKLLDVEKPHIDLLNVYQQNKIVYFALDLQGYGDTAKRMGRMILQDLKTVSSYIQSQIPASRRHFFPVFVDDAASFLDLNFVDFLNKSRAARIGIALFHQSLADLSFRAAPNFQAQVIENTNIKIILRQDDPWAVEKFTKIAGTRRTMIPTYQTEERLTGKGLTGTGSIREGQTFRIEPDLIKALKRGEAVVIWKNPAFLAEYIKLDFFGYPPYPGPFKVLRGKELEKVQAASQEAELTPPQVVQDGRMPPDVEDSLAYVREFETKTQLRNK